MVTSAKNIWAVIPAAGSGTRLDAATPKQYLSLLDRAIIEHTLTPFLALDEIKHIVVAIAKDDQTWHKLSVSHEPKISTIIGGATRAQSVLNGVQALTSAQDDDWVLVHDAVRPCLSRAKLQELIMSCEGHPVGGLLALPPSDTLKLADADGTVLKTTPRDNIWRAQTPQLFRLDLLREALQQFPQATDEANALELAGFKPLLVPGCPRNLKITHRDDIQLAADLLAMSTASLVD